MRNISRQLLISSYNINVPVIKNLKYTYLLPIDAFRIAISILSALYFIKCLIEVPIISSPEGLIDHELLLEYLWPARWGLFQPGLQEPFFYIIFSLAILLSCLLMLGIRPKLNAFILYLLSVSTYRWSINTFHIEDIFIHLALFWLIFLPIGQTLKIRDKNQNKTFRDWLNTKAPAFTVQCFKANISFVWICAGVLKFNSEMWLEGFALYPTLKCLVSRYPDIWQPEHLTFLKPLTFLALITEPLIPLFLFTRNGSLLKYFGLFLMISLHGSIALLTTVPISNLIMLSSALIFFEPEIMSCLKKKAAFNDEVVVVKQPLYQLVIPPIVVLLIISASFKFFTFLKAAPIFKVISTCAMYLLWAIGLAQGYSLFDWIDSHNFYVQNEVSTPTSGAKQIQFDRDIFFTTSSRSKFLLAPINGGQWVFQAKSESKRAHLTLVSMNRYISNFCRTAPAGIPINAYSNITVITPENLYSQKSERRLLTSFKCRVRGDRDPEIDTIRFYGSPYETENNLGVPELIYKDGEINPWTVIKNEYTSEVSKNNPGPFKIAGGSILTSIELISKEKISWSAEIEGEKLNFKPDRAFNDYYTFKAYNNETEVTAAFGNSAPDDAVIKLYFGKAN